MKKKRTVLLSIWCAFGILLFIIGNLLPMAEYYSSLTIALGLSAFTCGAILLIFDFRNTRPKNRAAYEKRLREKEAILKDERKIFLRYRAGYITWTSTLVLLLVGTTVASWLQITNRMITLLFAVVVIEYIVGTIIYKYLCKKM